MNFGSWLLNSLKTGFNFIGDMLYELMRLISKPLSYVYYFFEGIFYFIYQLFNVVVKVVMIFVALIQFFVSIVTGFVRTIIRMLTINYDAAAVTYPSKSMDGIQVVMDLLEPIGFLTIVPMIILAMVWLFFIKKMIGLIGGGGASSD